MKTISLLHLLTIAAGILSAQTGIYAVVRADGLIDTEKSNKNIK